jgi:hypothetical protein
MVHKYDEALLESIKNATIIIGNIKEIIDRWRYFYKI